MSAKDQKDVSRKIQDISHNHRRDHWPGHVMGLQIRADHEKHQPRREAERANEEIALRRRDQFMLDADTAQQKRTAEENRAE